MKFVLLYAALALAVNGGLDGVVTVDTTTLPDTTLTVMETETASPPTPEPTLEPTTTKLTEKPTLTTSTTSVGNAADSAADIPSDTTADTASNTASDATSDTSPAGPRTTTLYPLLLAPAPLVVTVYASNPDTTTSSSTTSSSSSSTESPSYIVTPGAAIESTYDSVSAIVTTIPTTYPVTTINGRTITLIDVTIDSLAAAAGKTGGAGGGVVTLYQTVVSGHTSDIVSTLYSTRTGVVTAHPYETLLPITMTLGGNVIVVTKKTTVTPLNNWGTKWDQLVWIDTTYYSSPAPFTYSAASVTANGAAALTAPVEMLRALSWTWAVAAASAVAAVMAL